MPAWPKLTLQFNDKFGTSLELDEFRATYDLPDVEAAEAENPTNEAVVPQVHSLHNLTAPSAQCNVGPDGTCPKCGMTCLKDGDRCWKCFPPAPCANCTSRAWCNKCHQELERNRENVRLSRLECCPFCGVECPSSGSHQVCQVDRITFVRD